MKNTNCDKMILAVLQGDDYHEAIEDLNEHGFYATVLNSSGGFLRRKSVTVMIGLNHEDLEEALQILKQYGERTEIRYQTSAISVKSTPMAGMPFAVPIRCGGVVAFVLDVERYEKY